MKTSDRSVRTLSFASSIRRIAGVGALALTLCAPVMGADAKLKIATVDMQQLFKEFYKTNQAQKKINVERAKIQKDNNERVTRIKELDGALQSMRKQLDDPAISDSRSSPPMPTSR